MPIALDGIRTCTSGIRAHRAYDYTATAGTPPVTNSPRRSKPAYSDARVVVISEDLRERLEGHRVRGILA